MSNFPNKKSKTTEFPKTYDPKEVEDKIYKLWEKFGYFNPDKLSTEKKETFCVMIAPPNVTGSLHMGHALENTLVDILVRFKRMQGYKTLWVPGTDHAGIATQNVVEKELKKEGLTKYDLGREKFIERVWKWKEKYGNIILDQLKKLGCSFDWSRTRFTLDENYSKAVLTAFEHYYKKGWIYQGERIINWCSRCESSISDLEVEYKEMDGKLYYVKYKVKQFPISNFQFPNKSQIPNHKFQNYIIVATTRPETILADTAVAVNPNDKRYKNLIGKKVIVPIVNREVPVVADKDVDIDFGTGVLKITPGHDELDFEIGQRHNIPTITVIDLKGRMNGNVGKYKEMKVKEAREKFVQDSEKAGLLEKVEDYKHNVGFCERCHTKIEPLISKQWFVKMNELGKMAVDAAKNNKVEFYPKRWKRIYLNWLSEVKDWNISRQLWWGHRLPVWHKESKKPVDITYFVHGTTTDNEKGFSSGWAQGELSELGKKQAKELRELVKDKKFDVVFCSDLKRAIDSASLVFENKCRIIKDKRLRECNYGDLNQASEDKVDYLERINDPFPKGESLKDVEGRTLSFLIDIQDKYAGKKIAVLAHKAPQLALEVLLNGKTWEQAIREDWRMKKAWQPGWNYKLKEIVKVSQKSPGNNWKQDDDVLDTWFSSALWPFVTLGWSSSVPKGTTEGKSGKTKDLKTFYPTQLISSARDILHLWITRMIFSGLEFMDEVPFSKVYIHPTVLTKEGKRMSKSLGTGIDPLILINKYGSDALRFGLAYQTFAGQDIHFSEEVVQMGKKFCNKVWNATRFITMNLDNKKYEVKKPSKNLSEEDKKILNKYEKISKEVSGDIESLKFGYAAHKLYDFFWHDFCDIYLEVSKKQDTKETKQVLIYVLVNSLKLLHPFTPFITEEIWQNLRKYLKDEEGIFMVGKWPEL